MTKSIAQIEILDGKGDLQEMNLLLLLKRSRTRTIGLSPLENHDPEGMNVLGVIDQGHAVVQGQGDVVGVTHLMKKRRSRSERKKDEYRSSKDNKRRDGSPPQDQSKGHQSRDEPSHQTQRQVVPDQQRDTPSQPSQATAPSPAGQQAQAVATRVGPAQTAPAQAVQAAPAQLLATQVIGASTAQYPLAKAMPIQQQPQAQPLPQPLPQPLYPPNMQVASRPQAQQLAAPPGLEANLVRTQAAQIQQMQQEMARLQAQLQATQAPAAQRQSSNSPSGNWNWNDQPGQWYGHGWQGWGNGRGYQ